MRCPLFILCPPLLISCTCTSTSLVGSPDGDAILPDTFTDEGFDTAPDPEPDVPPPPPDCLFTMRYMSDPEPSSARFMFDPELRVADVYFAMDTSVSMEGEVANLRNSLQEVIVPGVREAVPDAWFGVGQFQDCRRSTICHSCMGQMQSITGDIDEVQDALHAVGTLCGGWEPYTHMLWVLATGDTDPLAGYDDCVWPIFYSCEPPDDIGWPCFRDGSLPIIVQIGDEPFQEGIDNCPPEVDRERAIEALNSIGAKYVGVNSGWSRDDMEIIANATGSFDTSGTPLVFDIPTTGIGLGSQVVDAISTLALDVALDISARVADDPEDDVDATIFVDRIVAVTESTRPDVPGTTRYCPSDLDTVDTDGDTVQDAFTSIMGQSVCFDVYPARNTTVAPTTEHQVFNAKVQAMGDGVTVLGSHEICFVVPAVY